LKRIAADESKKSLKAWLSLSSASQVVWLDCDAGDEVSLHGGCGRKRSASPPLGQ